MGAYTSLQNGKRSLTTFPIQRNASEALVELSLSIGVEEIVAAES